MNPVSYGTAGKAHRPGSRRADPDVPLAAIDLFCGAGGLSLAFHREGFHIVAAVEKDAAAAESYRRSFISQNSRTTILFADDIFSRKVTEGLRRLRTRTNAIDILIGGPPCQDFSPARIKRRRKGERATLVQQYFSILGMLMPRAFLFENVPGLLTASRGRYWKGVQEGAARLGYNLYSAELRAEDFEVPQRRERLFVVGLKRSLGTFTFPSGTGKTPPSVKDTIGHLPALNAGQASTDPMHRARAHRPETVKYLAKIKQGESWRQATTHRMLPCHRRHNGHYDVYGRMTATAIAPTMTGGCTNPSKGRFIHPTQHRGLTVREAALLQTFPGDWEFCGGVEAASLQVGNAVPVRLGQALALSLRAVLRNERRLGAESSTSHQTESE